MKRNKKKRNDFTFKRDEKIEISKELDTNFIFTFCSLSATWLYYIIEEWKVGSVESKNPSNLKLIFICFNTKRGVQDFIIIAAHSFAVREKREKTLLKWNEMNRNLMSAGKKWVSAVFLAPLNLIIISDLGSFRQIIWNASLF